MREVWEVAHEWAPVQMARCRCSGSDARKTAWCRRATAIILADRRELVEACARKADGYRAELGELHDDEDRAHDIASEEIAGRIRLTVLRSPAPGGTK